jgi:hypothetical protein
MNKAEIIVKAIETREQSVLDHIHAGTIKDVSLPQLVEEHESNKSQPVSRRRKFEEEGQNIIEALSTRKKVGYDFRERASLLNEATKRGVEINTLQGNNPFTEMMEQAEAEAHTRAKTVEKTPDDSLPEYF